MRLRNHLIALLASTLIVAPGAALANTPIHAGARAIRGVMIAPRAVTPTRATPHRVIVPRRMLATTASLHRVALRTTRPAPARFALIPLMPVSTPASAPRESLAAHANATAYINPVPMPGWNRDWHSDVRYDWVGWRAMHRALFRPGYYYPPSGDYAYNRLEIGALLAPAFLGEQFRINNPGLYHLPPAQGDDQWVRYYNDCLLVNIDTGEVIDVAYGVFI